MLYLKKLVPVLFISATLCSCGSNQGEDTGHSTPIDSTITNGTAPATYGGDNPANYQDTTLANSNDTGTRARTGPINEKTPNQ